MTKQNIFKTNVGLKMFIFGLPFVLFSALSIHNMFLSFFFWFCAFIPTFYYFFKEIQNTSNQIVGQNNPKANVGEKA